MVRPRIFWFLIPLLTLLAGAPASAQGILEQMENEVSAIVNRTRGAVVTIYDARLPQQIQRSDMMPDQQKELIGRLNALQNQRQSVETRISQLQSKLKAGEIQAQELQQAQQERSNLDAQIGAYRRGLPGTRENSAATQWQTYVYQVAVAPKSGSGFSIGDGYIVTTADVLEGMQNPVILTDNGLRIQAHIVGIDSDVNIGLLQSLAKTNLPALSLGDSTSVGAGHFAICIGNQSGQENAVALMMVGGVRTEGTNSGRHFYPSLLQIAGTVGAGASGSPLVNSRGQVIGMMAAIPISEWTFIPSDSNQIPRFLMGGDRAVVPDNPIAGHSRNASPPSVNPNNPAGVLSPAPPNDAPSTTDTTPPTPGVEIGGVTLAPATPQNTAPSIRKKHQNRNAPDLSLNNNPFNGYIPPAPPVPIWRPPVTSEGFAIPINDIKPILEDLRAGVTRQRVWIGLRTSDEINTVVEDNLVKMTPFVHILNVVPDSPAARSGIASGDILVRIGERPIKHEADIHAVMLRLRPGQTVPIVVKRADGLRTFTLKIEMRPNHIEETDTRPEKVQPKPMPIALRSLSPDPKLCPKKSR